MKTIKEKKFVARQGANFTNDIAEELGKYLSTHQLDLNNYRAIYEDAKNNEASPFRNLLQWDNSQAAEEYRLGQVREIVQHISIEIIYEEQEKPTVLPRAFELVSRYDDEPQQLIGILEGLSEEDTRKQIISRAFNNLSGWWSTYQAYKEFGPLEGPIDQIRNELVQNGTITQ